MPSKAPLESARCCMLRSCGFLFVSLAAVAPASEAGGAAPRWRRHTIDDASRGADGVRLADANRDGLPDIATGWEEGGLTRVCLHPGRERVKEKWPAVTVGKTTSVEDAVLVDLDADGALDVVSCCEGRTRTLYIHWAPKAAESYLDPRAWKTEALPGSRDMMAWMFCAPAQVDGKGGVDLVVGGKGEGAAVGWFEAPGDPRDLAAWQWHPICDAGWIMSLVAADMDGDGDRDIVVSDRYGPDRGCYWLENPGPGGERAGRWPRHVIGGGGRQVMFLHLADLDRDGLTDVLVATKPREILFLRRKAPDGTSWAASTIHLPGNTGTTKAVAAGDVDLDGRRDIVFTCEQAGDDRSGCMWLSYRSGPSDAKWDAHEVGGPEGTKYDLVELVDLDGDGDLDVLTCAEQPNLGVFWYENPLR